MQKLAVNGSALQNTRQIVRTEDCYIIQCCYKITVEQGNYTQMEAPYTETTVIDRNKLLITRIEIELKRRGWTNADLVRASGVVQSSVYNFMSHKRGIDPATMGQIGKALDIPPLELAYYAGLADAMPTKEEIQMEEIRILLEQADDVARNGVRYFLIGSNRDRSKRK